MDMLTCSPSEASQPQVAVGLTLKHPLHQPLPDQVLNY